MKLPWQTVRKEERGLTLALALPYFLIIAAFTLGKIARDTLFLLELPAAYLPFLYVAMAALAALATAALGRLRQASAKLRLSLVLAATGLSLLLFVVWFRSGGGAPAVAFYLWTGVYGLGLVAEFWLLANERIDSRQARRLFGPIGAGGVLGGLVAAAAATAIAPLIDTLWLLGGGLLALLLPAAGAAWAVLGTRLYELTMRFSMGRTAWELLYFPLSDEIKARAKRLVDVVVNRSADAGAGLLLLLVNFALGGSLRQLTVLIVLLAAGWLLLDLRLNRAYSREVERSLRRLVPERAEESVILGQVAPPADLVGLLDDPDEGRVVHAMVVLERVDRQAVLERAPALARHRSAAVRARLLAIVAASGGDPDRYAFWAPGTDRDLAGTSVEAAGLPETPDERVAIAAAAGAPGSDAAYGERLAELMNDANADVRRTAFRGMAVSGDRSRLPHLIDRLAVARDREAVREALVVFGERIAGTLGDYLVDANVPFSVQHTLMAVLAEIGGPEAAYSLYRASRLQGDRRVVDGALRALLHLRRRDPELRLPQPQILDDLRQEVQRDGHRLIQLRTVRESADPETRSFLDRVLRERLDQSFRRIFRRLALAYPTGRALAAFRGLRSGRPRVRAQAIEYLDTLLPADLARALLPLVEAPDNAERERQAVALFGSEPLTLEATLDQLLRSREPWLRACGLYVVGKAKKCSHRDRALELAGSLHPLVRDTAAWAVRRLS